MPYGSLSILVSCFFGVSGLASNAAADAGPSSAPRYRLHVGQELVYRSTWSSVAANDSSSPAYTDASVEIFRVTSENPGGGWHLVEEVHPGGGWEQAPQLAAFDLMPDGEIRIAPEAMTAHLNPSDFFPRLRPDGAARTWQGSTGEDETATYHIVPADDGAVIGIDASFEGLLHRLYRWVTTCHIRFDAAEGLVVNRVNAYDEQLYQRKETFRIELLMNQTRPEAQMKQFGTGADAVLATLRRYDELMDAAEVNEDGSEGRMLDARQLLGDERTKIASMEWPPPNPSWWPVILSRVLNTAAEKHSIRVEALRNELRERAALIGKPGAAWELSDLQGGRHVLKDLAGKVVVLDFWYRGCGWCMRAMPDMKQLAENYRQKPVAFFAVNTDSKPEDAKFVAEFFALPYPTLLAAAGADQSTLQNAAVAEQYHVRAFPTVIVIGPDGRVRAIEVGYHRLLRERLSKEIDGLLRPPTTNHSAGSLK